jgi:choline dehydrogenase-like flavoprotein
MTIVIIGSGPAGVAAAQALADTGRRVTILDAGDRIEAGRMDVFDTLASSEPEQWSPELIRRARRAFPVGIKHVPLKPAYGSLFPYALDDPDLPITCENADTLPSLAYGGLSNSWGASILPVHQRDITDWPISLAELEPHYRAVLRFVPIAAEYDELAGAFPLYTDSPGMLRRGPQTEMLLSRMHRHPDALRTAGFSLGASRLAVITSMEHSHRCRYSGMCLYGCPYGSVYNASHTLEALIRDDKVEYRGGIYVDRLTEAGDSVTIDFHQRRRATEKGRLTAARVFVACGSISSTRLMLDSMGRGQSTRQLQDSQYFMLPMLTTRAAPISAATQGNTLAQIFIELDNARISMHTIHLQLYGYNDLMLSALTKRFPIAVDGLERALRPLLGRLVAIQGYLHSAESPRLTLHREADRMRVVGDGETVGAASVRRLIRHLTANRHLFGMMPIPQLVQIGRPGKSNHLGGSLPMRHEPDEQETDTLGRLPNWDRVHVIDASVLPSIPATTVTFSVMANAHRIATTVSETAQGSGTPRTY